MSFWFCFSGEPWLIQVDWKLSHWLSVKGIVTKIFFREKKWPTMLFCPNAGIATQHYVCELRLRASSLPPQQAPCQLSNHIFQCGNFIIGGRIQLCLDKMFERSHSRQFTESADKWTLNSFNESSFFTCCKDTFLFTSREKSYQFNLYFFSWHTINNVWLSVTE